jgi:hypothetical protein
MKTGIEIGSQIPTPVRILVFRLERDMLAQKPLLFVKAPEVFFRSEEL